MHLVTPFLHFTKNLQKVHCSTSIWNYELVVLTTLEVLALQTPFALAMKTEKDRCTLPPLKPYNFTVKQFFHWTHNLKVISDVQAESPCISRRMISNTNPIDNFRHSALKFTEWQKRKRLLRTRKDRLVRSRLR